MNPTILLVEDNKELADVIAEDFMEQYEILKAQNGQQALQLLAQNTIHLIISDVMMPIMNGFELCQAVKSDFKYSHIPFLLLTAKNSLAAKIEGLSLGADAYIDKPFDMEYLLAQVGSLLHNRKKIEAFHSNTITETPKNTNSNKSDILFLDTLTKAIHDNIDDHELDVDKLARFMSMSRTTFFRKIKTATTLTPNELINQIRLVKAAELLTNSDYKIYEVADMVGYSSQTNFGRTFYKQFGMTPTEYQRKHQL